MQKKKLERLGVHRMRFKQRNFELTIVGNYCRHSVGCRVSIKFIKKYKKISTKLLNEGLMRSFISLIEITSLRSFDQKLDKLKSKA